MESPAHHPQKSFYWVDQGVSPPIEDQGKSNHCMIFASASALACSYYIKNRSNWIDFSVQQVLDNCAMEFKNPESRIKFFQYLNGGMDITTKDNYPSNIHNGCLVKQPFDSSKVKSPFVRAQWKKVNGLQNMMEAVKKNPLVGCICADDKIKQVLKDGRVYKNHVEGKRNHAILILGYGTSDEEGDFWYVQNSWGGIWGEGGIGKIARGVGMCKIEVSAYFPELIDTIETASKVEESVVRIGSHSVEDAAGAACGASLLMPFPQTSMAWKESRPVSDYSARSTGNEESLKFRLLGSDGDIGSWGHEYVRNLAGEIAHEYTKRQSGDGTIDDLMDPVQQIVAFHMQHIAEPEAVDLLMEGEDLDLLFEHVDRANYKRTCLYLTAAARYLPGPDDKLVLDIDEYASALQIALYLGNLQYVKQIFTTCNDLQCKKQFCYILARHVSFLLLSSVGHLLCVVGMEPKSPEDIYKAHLLDGRASAGSTVDSARQNLAATFVNAFLNAGFGQDKLTTLSSEATGGSASGNWLFKNKEHGKTSAAASLGMILQWDVDSGLAQIGKYFHSNNNHVIAGALLGVGIVNSSVKNDCDPALALLSDYVDKEDPSVRIGAIMGLGISYANTQNEMVRDKLKPILEDSEAPLDVVAFTAISLGLVYVGSCNEEVAQAIILSLMDRSESELGEPLSKFLPLGLGLLYLGRQENVEGTAEVSKTFNEKIRQHCDMTLLSCAYAGTGNVLKVQSLLGHCAQHLDKTETDQAPAVIGIAIIAMAEELGVEMAIRSLEHLLQYGEQNIRRAFPLALGLLCISNPKVNVMDTLSRLSHDSDSEVAMAAIISLGLIGAETNNARITGMFGNLSSYYYKDASSLSCVRIAQGLVHLGKGLLTLDPYHSDRFLLSPTALAGLPIMMRTCLDMKAVILGKYHYVLYFLVLAMQPRMLMTVDENLKPLSVPVRVGQAVDVVGQVGRPKTIAGFQTHSTPVLLAAGDRAELATEKYIPLSPIL